MGYLPVFLDVGGRPCVVIGGGKVAERKVLGLISAGAEVTVISPIVTVRLGELARAGRIRHIARTYARDGDVRGSALVYAATRDANLNQRVAREARELGIPVNVADAPTLCTFISPAVVNLGALKIAVSTSGASPAMAGRIRRRLERMFGPEYGLALEIIRAARQRLKASEPNAEVRARKLSALAASRLVPALARGDIEAARRIVRRHTGADLGELGVIVNDVEPKGRLAPGAGCEGQG